MTGEAPQLLPDTDYLLDKDKAAMGTVLTAYEGGDPLVDPPKFGYPEHMQTEIERRMVLEGDRTKKMNEGVFLNPESGWGQIKGFMDGVFEKYKGQNESQLIKKPRDEQEAIAQMEQMRPVQVDPNEVANMRQLAVKLDQQMKAIDPRTSFWTDPRTKKYAEWLNRESGPGTAGFMQSGEQPVELGAVGRVAYSAWQGVEGIGSGATSIVHGLWDLGRQSINSMGGPDIGPSYPTNFIETEDGQMVSNGGKAPSILDGIAMTWAYATNQNIEQFAAKAGRAQEWELANREGLSGLATSVSRLGGELVGMAPGFGAAAKVGEMTLGKLTQKGLQSLGTLRLAKGAQQSERALKIIGSMGKGLGQASGMAAYESMTQGRVEGYGSSYLHGLMMAPVLMTLGALGKKTEWFAKNRAGMPAAASRAIGGAMEGIGFGAIETTIPDLLPSAWGFIRDPNQSTFEAYMKNMLAFSMVKMATGRTTGAASPEQMQIKRGIGRSQFAEKVARGEATPEEVAKAPVPNEAKLRDLGMASMRSREGKTPEERSAATKTQREIERLLDIEEMGKGPAEKAVNEFGVDPNYSKSFPLERKQRAPGEIEDVAAREVETRRGADKAFAEWGAEQRKLFMREPEAGGVLGELVRQQRADREQAVRDWKPRETDWTSGRVTEPVPGKAPKPHRTLEDKGAPEKQMFQEGGREGLEPERLAAENPEALRAARERRIATMRDPIEDPRFRELPEAVQEEILAAPDAGMRKQIFAERVLERRDVPRGTSEPAELGVKSGEPTELEARSGDFRTPSGARAGPQSLQQQPTRQVEATPGVEQVTARDIYAEMEGRPGRKGFRIPFTSKRIGDTPPDEVRVAIRGGKVGGRSVLGVFKHHENLIRTKEGRDLAVVAHEWSHRNHRRALEAGGNDFVQAAKRQMEEAIAMDPKIAQEMADTLKDYPGSQSMQKWLQWAETWAEWHARNLLGEVGLDKRLPAVSHYMRTWLAVPKQAGFRPQYERLQNMIYRYNAQGSLGRLRQSRVSDAAPPTETQKATQPGPIKRLMTTINKALLDDMAELKMSQDRWLEAVGRKPEDVSITEDPARMFDTLRMTSNKTVEHFVNSGIRLPGGEKVPGLRSVMDAVKGRTEDFQDFVVAVRSLELYKKNKEVQLPPQDYVESVKQLSAKNPDFVDQLSNLKRWTDALVDYVAGAGNISPEDAQRIKDAYVVYVPFFRAIEGPAQHGQGRGVAERGTGLSRIKGSTYEVRDPFISLQQVARSMVAKAHQNQVMTALFKMSVGQEAGGLASIVQRTNVPTDHPLRRLLDAIEAKVQLPGDKQHELESVFEALREADALNPDTITTFSQKVIPTGERNIIAFTPRLSEMEIDSLVQQGAHRKRLLEANNKLQWLEVDTKVYEALIGIDKMPQLPEAMQPVMQWIQAPRDLVRFFATGVAPGFVAANLLRDAMSAPIFNREGKFRPLGGFVNMVRGAIEYHKKGEMRELYEELGVKTSSFWTEGRQRALIGEQVGLWQKAKAMADTVQNWFSHPENYIRMAEFKDTYNKAKAEGKPEFEARMLALEGGREITVNFARAGIWARVLNQAIPYFNAGLQGQRKLWGQLVAGGADTKGDANKARVQRGAILNGIANLTVPATLLWLMNKDEEWYQDLPEWRKINYFNMKLGGEIVSVPKPFEAGIVFASLPEIMLDHLFGKNPAGMKEAMKSVAGPYIEFGTYIPAIIKPLLEVSSNKSFFTKRPLTPEWIAKSSPPEEQATFYTTEIAKIMSRALGGILTPTEIEALGGGYTAGATTKAMRALDEIAGLKDHPGISLNPFQRFMSQQPHGQSDFVDQLYELGTKLDQREDTLDTQGKILKRRVDTAKRQISSLRKSYQAGAITKEEAERRSYELARPLIEQQDQR